MNSTIIFGFLGSFPATHSSTDLAAYGTRVCGHTFSPFESGGRDLSGLCAPTRVGDHHVALGLRGNPVWLEPADTPASATSILEAYSRQGPSFLRSLRGRYALAIVDRRERQVLLAVDPMGIERMTYAVLGDAVVFSTSAEAVGKFAPVSAGIDDQAIFAYLLHHVIPNPATVFAGVRKLPPASHLLARCGAEARVERHWTPEFADRTRDSFDSLRSALHDSLGRAVADCRPNDRTGAFLSGGLDSSTVAGMLAAAQPSRASTFTIGFGYPDYDELPYSRIANARFGCEAHEYIVRGDDIASTFHKIAQAYDEPFGNSSALPTYHCARMAREAGIDHLLAGDGGDELFAGNSRYADQLVFEWYQRVPEAIRLGLLEPALEHWPETLPNWLVRKGRGYVAKANTPLPTRLEAWNFVFGLGPSTILQPDFLARVRLEAPFDRMREVWAEAPTRSTLQRMLYYDWNYTLADNDLRKVEVMSEMAGVRVSYPMLDHRVVELSTRIAPDVMMPGRKLRDFYKRAMQGYLPDEIINKKKHGFGLPFGLWLQESAPLRELIFGSLSSLRGRGIVQPAFIDRLLDLHGSEDARYYGVFIWVLAMLEQWFQEHGSAR